MPLPHSARGRGIRIWSTPTSVIRRPVGNASRRTAQRVASAGSASGRSTASRPTGTSTFTITGRCPRSTTCTWSIRSRTCRRFARTATRCCIWAGDAGPSKTCGGCSQSKVAPNHLLLHQTSHAIEVHRTSKSATYPPSPSHKHADHSSESPTTKQRKHAEAYRTSPIGQPLQLVEVQVDCHLRPRRREEPVGPASAGRGAQLGLHAVLLQAINGGWCGPPDGRSKARSRPAQAINPGHTTCLQQDVPLGEAQRPE